MIVLVHGVPETAALWDRLRSHLDDESVALALPGFGCPRPPGFTATKDAYVAWAVGQLDALGEPVDLVGHDWGAGITFRIATAFGDRLRSWTVDVGNVMHPDYVWHRFAQTWQTPGEGEAFFARQAGVPVAVRAEGFERLRVPHADAEALAAATDDTMAGCILDLYRSATPNPAADWRADAGPTAAPGLVLCPTADPFGDQAMSRQVADHLGARHQVLDGLGHWWALEAPEAAAALLTGFHRSVADR